MRTTLFVRMALWSLCAYIFVSCGQSVEQAPSFTTSNASLGLAQEPQATPEQRVEYPTVYVCHSPGAKKYHLRQNCGALKRCKHEIRTMSSDAAEKMGLGLCGYED